jgi:prephenate dehydratase
MRVAIQGELGSFSHEAAKRMAPRSAIVPCTRSAEVFDRLERGSVAAAVIPIENSLAGSVAEHLDLLLTRNVFVQREFRLRIVHNLIVAPGITLKSVVRVLSHPVALDQCRDLFRRYPRMEAMPFYDTAGSIKHVLANRLKDAAGIAGTQASREYGGKILLAGIEDDKRNFTRFFLIRRGTAELATGLRAAWLNKRNPRKSLRARSNVRASAERARKQSRLMLPGANKTSIAFKVKNVPGALFKALSVFALRDISLNKIESRPMRGRPWEYVFYVDFMRGDDEPARNALHHLGEVSDLVKVLGIYPAA